MKSLIEEQGILVASSVIGITVIGLGYRLFVHMSPMIEMYLASVM